VGGFGAVGEEANGVLDLGVRDCAAGGVLEAIGEGFGVAHSCVLGVMGYRASQGGWWGGRMASALEFGGLWEVRVRKTSIGVVSDPCSKLVEKEPSTLERSSGLT